MTSAAQEIFFGKGALNRKHIEAIVEETLQYADDGELFLEYAQSEGLSFDDGCIRNASFDTTQGFGLRAVIGETTGFAHASDLSEDAIKRASQTVLSALKGKKGKISQIPIHTGQKLYSHESPLDSKSFQEKVDLLTSIDGYLRKKDSRVVQVSASLNGEWQAISILRHGGTCSDDHRPLIRLTIRVIVSDGKRMEAGTDSIGGRYDYLSVFITENWQANADEALRQALVNLEAIPAPAGEMPVVLGAGWPGVLLHEAVGHGLEGDFNRKKSSVFSELMGKRVAAKGVTVIDDGTIQDRRGSLSIDDEGTPTQRNVLIEDGILKKYMTDRLNARLMGGTSSGNGRRESYASTPLPRMTNTFMLPGDHTKEEIIKSVKKGLYAVNFGGGQVDITNGKFVFSASEAYLIEDGKITKPVKGATLVGSGAEVLKKISMIGNDLALDPGVGTCSKDGQGVPVGVGQPTLLVDCLTVGGTSA
ncbi:MAG: metalloprotease TldD [Alphaproteobacteria bacterium]|jgi:TldD protein|nr:metalloprotease TldD [Alphaproteobacteria bacterium]MBT5389406.1 metalloprotease TldD [Alphaproteobacteria bacterium]MBT5655100.1 metalloprotease TldD [Alphaproteobacteria bacterium]